MLPPPPPLSLPLPLPSMHVNHDDFFRGGGGGGVAIDAMDLITPTLSARVGVMSVAV